MSSLAAMFGGGGDAGGFGGLGGGAPPVEDPETAYASQLTQLQARWVLGGLLAPGMGSQFAHAPSYLSQGFRHVTNCNMIWLWYSYSIVHTSGLLIKFALSVSNVCVVNRAQPHCCQLQKAACHAPHLGFGYRTWASVTVQQTSGRCRL